MADFVRPSNKLLLRGMNLTLPSDRLGLEWAQLLQNVRSYRIGAWRQRPGMVFIADANGGASGTPVWGRRISATNGAFRRFMAFTSGDVFGDDASHTSFAGLDTGYSGDPLTSVIARPDQATEPSMFVGDSLRISKFNRFGARTNWGIAAPVLAPTAELVQISFRTIDDCESTAGFTGSGGAVTAPARVSAIAISQILYDTGSTGWASVAPASMDENWQEGMFVTTSAGVETVIIESIYPQIAATTIGSIAYDTGSTGLCTIQLATPTQGLQRNSLIRINSAENVRVLSVTTGPDNIPSLRCVTVGTFSAGQAVVGFRSFRAYFANTHTTAETLSTNYVQLAVAASGISTLTKTTALDLSSTASGGAVRPTQADDGIHISLRISDFASITEIQIQFDIDSTTNDFTQNYFFKSIRQPDLLAAVQQTASSLTAQQQEIQRQQIDEYRRQQLEQEREQLQNSMMGGTVPDGFNDPIRQRLVDIETELGGGYLINPGQGSISAPGATGASQWSEFKFPLSSFQRVGADETRTWKDVAAFRISVNATAAVDVGVDALWIGGTFGPDHRGGDTNEVVSDQTLSNGYTYVYIERNEDTGTRSNPSPPMRSPIFPEREAVTVTASGATFDTQTDVLDWFRIGGTLGDYFYVGTTPVSSPTLIDTIPDDIAKTYTILTIDRYQPWTISDSPRAGVVNVVGTKVTRVSGDFFNTSWARGSQIIIGGQTYSLYTNPSSTSALELNENAGTQTSVAWQMPEGLLTGQPLPVVFGPYTGGAAGQFVFGLGDAKNPGRLYWTNGGDVEGQSDVNYIDLCDPGERLMSGTILDGIIYVWSNVRSWRILPSFDGGQSGGGSTFYSQQTAMGKGMCARWALTVGDRLYFMDYDGIWASRGDAVESLTDEALTPLFKQEGSNTWSSAFAAGFAPISFAAADLKYLHLTYSRDGLYLNYRDIQGAFMVMYYSFLTKGWVYDLPAGNNVALTIREEGPEADTVIYAVLGGNIYYLGTGQMTDNGTGFVAAISTREEDFGDSRSQKVIGDCMIDLWPNGQSVNAVAGWDNGTSSLGMPPALTGTQRTRLLRTFDDEQHRSMALGLSWTTTATGGAGPAEIYEWQPAALLKPEFIDNRATDWERPAGGHAVWLQGMRLTANTYGVAKDIIVEDDLGNVIATLSINHNGEVTTPYVWTPQVVHAVRIRGNDADNWQLMGVEWIWKTDAESVTRYHTQVTSLGLPEYWQIRDFLIALESSATVSLSVVIDGVSYGYSIPTTSGARSKLYLPAQAVKGKYVQFIFTSSAGFRLYLNDCVLWAKPWGYEGDFAVFHPFGDVNFDQGDGARI